MAGPALTVLSSLVCPHGGKVTIVPGNARVGGTGGLFALATDTFTVIGCPFQIPAVVPIPSPCLTVRWLVSDLKSTAGAGATLSTTSAGLCLSAAQVPQGMVAVAATQPSVASS